MATELSVNNTSAFVNHGSLGATYYQAAFFPLIPGGKTPAIDGWRSVLPGQYPPTPNYGIALTEGDLVLDFDPRNYPEGRNMLEEFLKEFQLPSTRVVRSPRGGLHIYFTKRASYKVRKAQPRWPGVDFLSAGAYVVGPGSQTPDGVYKLIYDLGAAELPVEILATLEKPAEPSGEGLSEATLLSLEQFVNECERWHPAVEGQRGDETTYKLACRGRDLGLPRDVVFEVMRDHYNWRCEPPWSEKELHDKVTHAFTYAKNGFGCDTPEAKFLSVIEERGKTNVVSLQGFQDGLAIAGTCPAALELHEKTGLPKNTLANIIYLLKNDPAWRGRLRYNQFTRAVEWTAKPTWREDQANEGTEITTRDIASLAAWFSASPYVRLEVSDSRMHSALYAAATPYHPVRDYLNVLVWDGVPRLDRILIDTAGADDNAYSRAVGKCVLLSAVKRIFEPGCKQDHIMVMESKQGLGKSTWVATLGGAWASSGQLVCGDKDTYMRMRGKWIIELPEFNATLTKQDYNWMKGIISTSVDTYRPPYGHQAIDVPRESIFIATINPTAAWTYLKDEENRRYWPIRTKKFDLKLLAELRDQYFAEAVYRYHAGEPIWLDTPELTRLAQAEQAARRESDPWIEVLTGWVEGHAIEGFTLTQCVAALGTTGFNVQPHHERRLKSVLQDMGLTFHRAQGGGGKWKRELTWEDLL